jgi:hypothetical protein
MTAQEKFVVPTPADLEKYQSSAWQWNGAYIILINYAKSLGRSAEDAGSSVGDIVKSSWSTDIGYEGFVKSMLYIWLIYSPQGTVEIREQTNDKIIFIIKNFFAPIKESLSYYKVTNEEYLKFLNNYVVKIADHMGTKYTQTNTDDGIIVTIERK